MNYVLGIDLGTSYFKLALFDPQGRLGGLTRLPVPKREHASRCEMDTDEFWATLQDGLQQACAQALCRPAEIAAVSYSSQANSFVLLDDVDRPLTPLILWPDMRARELPVRMRRLWEQEEFLEVTGLGLTSAQFMAAKLCWFQEEDPERWDQTAHVMTISDYLAHGLTALRAGDEGTASLLGLWDLPRHQWWGNALDALELEETRLSRPLPPGTVIGPACGNAASNWGLLPEIPVAAGSLDHHMAALGAGLGTVAEATDSTGTVLALLRNCEEWQPREGCCMGPQPEAQGYYQLAFSNEGAGALEAYQREFAPELTLPELLAMAEQPRDSERGAQVREILERAAGTLDGLVRTLYGEEQMGRCAATGGGARSDLWLQIKADLTGADFMVTGCGEPACLGAGMFAAVAAGWFPDVAGASRAWTTVRQVFTPRRQRAGARSGRNEPGHGISVG